MSVDPLLVTTFPSLTSLSDTCIQAAILAASPIHRAVLFFKISTCICGVIGDVWIWKHEGTRWLAHPNARLLYSLHLFWATVVSSIYMGPMIFDLIRFLMPKANSCDLLVSMYVSFWLRFGPAYAINAQSYAMLALIVERATASFFLKWYEKLKKPYLGMIILPAAQLYVLLVLPNTWTGPGSVSTSILTKDNSDGYSFHLHIQQVTESMTLVLFIIIIILNRYQRWKTKISVANVSILDVRYQIKEISKVVNSLLPCYCVHFATFYAPPLIISIRRQYGLSPLDNIRWIEFTSEFQLYSLFMPLLIYLLRRREKKKIVVNNYKGIDNHFEQFNAWIA